MNYKNLIKSFLLKHGYEVKKINAGKIRTSIYEEYLHLKGLGFNPKTVIDVGVASGTPELYKAFPDAYYILIEPVIEFKKDINSILEKHSGIWINKIATNLTGKEKIYFREYQKDATSTLKEKIDGKILGIPREVSCDTLDNIVSGIKCETPYLIKADVQGSELKVIDGAKGLIADSEAIILEVSMFKFFGDNPDFIDVLSYMNSLDFYPFNLFPNNNRPYDDSLAQIDIVFVKKNGSFRTYNKYC